ncbi:MAG: hypothetical protein ACLT97_05125 [Faecalibacillus intestinalis]|uniref:hypothetical protein n=1 Tax=Faecalibacillus intestinalis TaxID=1982626 RepID=UPI003992F2AE
MKLIEKIKNVKEKLIKTISNKKIDKNDMIFIVGLSFIIYASFCLNNIFGNYVTGIVFILLSFFSKET